jgi:Flp pilus assembly pilin Flp
MPPGKLRFYLDPRAEEGQAMVEYALIVALISIASLSALTILSANLQDLLETAAALITGVVAGL